MSLPEFPTPDPCLTRDQAINMILTSIAMEEIALSHVIEAESEKIKYTLDYMRRQNCCAGTERILEVNESASKLMETVLDIQMILKRKMDSALSVLPKPCPSPCPPPCPPSEPCPPRPGPKPEKGVCSVVCRQYKHSAVFAAKPFIWCCGSALPLSKQSTGCVDIGMPPSRDAEIFLPSCSRFIVNFNIEFTLLSPFADTVSVELRLAAPSQIILTERYHAFGSGNCVTASGSTIVETPGNCLRSYLCIELLSPCSVQVKSGRISIVEL